MKQKLLAIVILIIAAGLILSACGSSGGLAGTSWTLVSYGPANQQTPPPQNISGSIEFDKHGGVNWIVGCNIFSGKFHVSGDTIVFSKMVSTQMGCFGDLKTLEDFAVKVINGSVPYKLEDQTLSLTSASSDEMIVFSK